MLMANANLTGVIGSLLSTTNIVQKDSTGAMLLGGVRYSKFIKTDADFRKYYNFHHERQMIFRSYAGIAVPFGNGDIAVPFDKMYFTGGANGVRGWKIRTLGPGSSVDSNNIDKLGEIKIELNAEYRFKINSMIKGALFTDAGNIWRLEDKDDKAVFHFNRFYKELAIAAGAGLRFDFGFLVARIDLGWPIRKPYQYDVISFHLNEAEFNVGIGYPF
jgi:outer membrane protein assembly factor BamA